MSEGYSETTSKGWFERITESIKGVLVGLLLFVVAFPLLFWNEGRAIKTYLGLKEGESALVEIAPDKIETVDPANQDKLVHLTGLATTTETLRDTDFGVDINALRLRRVSEIYQWKQSEKKTTKKKLGGGEETVTEYTYDKVWADGPIDSSSFKVIDGHVNTGTFDFPSTSSTASKVTLGGFTLTSQLVGQINSFEPVPTANIDLAKGSEAVKKNWKAAGEWISRGADSSSPAIGDMRVKFTAVKPTTVSVVAQQTGNSFRPFTTSQKTTIEMLEVGSHSGKEMFATAQAANTQLTWILRGLGFFLMWSGIGMIFKPLVVIADVVPIFGNVLSYGVGFFAFLIALPLTLITIAIGWLYYRPVLGISLLVAAAVVFGLFLYLGRKKKSAAA